MDQCPDTVAREGFSERWTFKLRPKESEGGRHAGKVLEEQPRGRQGPLLASGTQTRSGPQKASGLSLLPSGHLSLLKTPKIGRSSVQEAVVSIFRPLRLFKKIKKSCQEPKYFLLLEL